MAARHSRAAKAPRGTYLRFLEKLVGTERQDCIIWPYAKHRDGYGHIRFQGRPMHAHRAMLILATGEPPADGLHAAHTCGSGRTGCVNPNHLEWKTPLENYRDKIEHGTAKITVEQARAIAADPRLQREIAGEYGITQAYVSGIKSGRFFADVTEGIRFAGKSEGARAGSARRLTSQQIAAIRSLSKAGLSQKKVAAKVGVGYQVVRRVLFGTHWQLREKCSA